MDKEVLIKYIQETENITIISEDLISPIHISNGIFGFIFNCFLHINSGQVSIRLIIRSDFPETLPKFSLPKYDAFGFLPHIEPDGGICFLEKESVYINTDEPKTVFQASVDLARQTLINGITGKNKDDFREEFHVFWERNRFINKSLIISVIDISDVPKEIQIIKDSHTTILFDLNRNIVKLKAIFFKNNPSFSKKGLFIPLSKDIEIIPPKYDQRWEIDEFVNWLKPKIYSEHWGIVTGEILNKKPQRIEYLILSIPRNTGANILVGIKLKPKKNTSHPLLEKNTTWGINLLKVSRLDLPSILPRGGANTDLQKKNVLLIGCGSVGSHIALLLPKTGLGKLNLVDPDKFQIENVNRFSIGFEHIGKYKVNALKDYLNKNILGTTISSYSKSFKDFLQIDNIDINSYDLVISATGDPTVNLTLNKQLKELNIPFIIGWNEPYGIGGHALISIDSEKGCYKCLYRNTYNIASFAAKNQPKPFYKKHLGCGEVYTPYSVLDSIKTSELVVRLANSFLTQKVKKSQILSWVGDGSKFLEEGFALSSRYLNQTPDEMNENKFNFINKECSHCREYNDYTTVK